MGLWIFKRAFRSRGRHVDRSRTAFQLVETTFRLVDRTGERDRTPDERAHRTPRLIEGPPEDQGRTFGELEGTFEEQSGRPSEIGGLPRDQNGPLSAKEAR